MINYTDAEKTELIRLLKVLQAASPFAASNQKYARTIGFTSSDLTNLYKSHWERVGDGKWIKLAKTVGYQKNERLRWVTAQTLVSEYVEGQLDIHKIESLCGIMVDDAGIGKTHTAKEYAKKTPNAFYMDCSVTPRKIAFIRKLAATVGLDNNDRIEDLIENIVYALQNMDRPILILDEAGDLEHLTILVLKRLYNALEGFCGIYLIGADGLKNKIENGIKWKKLGFTEFFSRFGKGFRKALPKLTQEKIPVLEEMAVSIAIANGITDKAAVGKIKSFVLTEEGLQDMRRIKREIIKMKNYEYAS